MRAPDAAARAEHGVQIGLRTVLAANVDL